MNLEKHFDSARSFVYDLATELGSPGDIGSATRILRSVFAVMRMRLTFQESFDLIAQLPLVIKGMYVENWRPRALGRKIKNVREFIEEILSADRESAAHDFGNEVEAREKVVAVFRVIKRYCSFGEALDISATLPKGLRDLWISA